MSDGQKAGRASITKVYSVVLVGALILVGLLWYAHISIDDWVVIYTLAGLLVLVQHYEIRINSNNRLFFDDAYLIAFSFAYPANTIIWAGIIYVLISGVINRKKHWHSYVMTGVVFIACTLVSQRVYWQLIGGHHVFEITRVFPLAVYAVTYFVINVLLITVYFLIESGKQGLSEFKRVLSIRFVVMYLIEILIALLLALVLHASGLAGALLFTGVVLLVAYSYKDYFIMANHFRDLAVKDELTGLYNHRWVQTWIDERISAQQRFSLLMLDIDHFRRYNEVWGHVQGDEALKTIATVLRANCLGDEQIARYSGEEFAIVLPDYDVHQAQLKAEIVRRSIEEAEFVGAERLPGHQLTVSLGVAAYPDMAETKKDLMMMVDDALYKGKFTGRNKVSIYTSVIDDMKRELALGDEEQEVIKTVKVFLAILNSKDRYTYAHTERDVRYADALGRRLGLDETSMTYLRFGSFLHDIGKVEIPIEVLTKRGPLTRDEWALMKSHVDKGVGIISAIPSLAPCIPIIRHHHERFDGTGYPCQLAGFDIPLTARILTVVDSFDAMTTSRPYQRKRTMEEAIEELRACAGKQFDPDLIEPFIEVVRGIGLLSQDDEEGLA